MKAITFTNAGYVEYTLNLLKSIEINGSSLETFVYCTDTKSYEILTKKGFNTIKLDHSHKISEKIYSWESAGSSFGRLMLKKFEAIHNSLLNDKYLLYLDGDVVVKSNFSNYLLENIKDNDFLFQLDYNPKKEIQTEACAGFMFLKSTNETRLLFNPKNIDFEHLINLPSHDQTYINNLKDNFKYSFLPPVNFPNGAFYYNFETSPKAIHFNYIIGKKKKKIMKKFNEWYL